MIDGFQEAKMSWLDRQKLCSFTPFALPDFVALDVDGSRRGIAIA
jgi:hypothetical protein